MSAIILKHELLFIISDYLINLLAANLDFTRAEKTVLATRNWLGWFLYNFPDETVISIREW